MTPTDNLSPCPHPRTESTEVRYADANGNIPKNPDGTAIRCLTCWEIVIDDHR